MVMNSSKDYWENIYQTRKTEDLSWTEEVPEISLSFIRGFRLPKTANIIDIGGGESKLADNLLREGFENITVLDISARSIERAKIRLGEKSKRITWIVQDVLDFTSDILYDCWHDRAAFHFLTNPDQISLYASLAKKYVKSNGYAVLGTFSESGPKKCSGLSITQYSPASLALIFSTGFEKINCITHDHMTPSNTTQNFLYCSFRRKSI
jgi:2-polyprenyl-3-methyl-5-hydroxy-6-metoxy-1,4-benzoquinol methylase